MPKEGNYERGGTSQRIWELPLSPTTQTRMCILLQGQTIDWILGYIINVFCVVGSFCQKACVQGAVMQPIIDNQRVSVLMQRTRTPSLQQLWRTVFRIPRNSDGSDFFRAGQRISTPNIRLESNASAEDPLLPPPASSTSKLPNTSSL
ncbi:hypothetical protein M758_4G271200 [Ceratodon purpureus]|nr:hypothetical protein M758_4G271200 [Ceratodon purpureus]